MIDRMNKYAIELYTVKLRTYNNRWAIKKIGCLLTTPFPPKKILSLTWFTSSRVKLPTICWLWGSLAFIDSRKPHIS